MGRADEPAGARRATAGIDAACPDWCRGCGPDDPMHRGLLATVGTERGGWVSVQLLLDRFRRREPVVKVDATRSGATESVLLSPVQLDRLIYELTYVRWRVMTKGRPLEGRYDRD
ncbi:hypothetical protein GCM10011608_38470 [Micromonospora sonchi]|uniref:Precorrin-4 C11-methyltransferase n=1 Tax=Micromonospora sonchi TaxID=1763543 RepID=A0A917U287_9ACTN|nr:hypothetical protein [Micromonospora sonchi]GGM49887.1 hypothetical protein GCM10011608_38470 [Micromonospora sonchi]